LVNFQWDDAYRLMVQIESLYQRDGRFAEAAKVRTKFETRHAAWTK